MNRRNTTFLIAACLSVGIHAAVFWTFPRYEVGGIATSWPAGYPAEEMTIVLEAEAEARQPEPEAQAEPLPEPEPEPEREPKQPPEFEMGASDGTGYASHDVPDEREAIAPEADTDQASLSLDPAGAGEHGADTAVVQATGEGSTLGQPGGSPPMPVAPAPPPPPVARTSPALPTVAPPILPPRAAPITPSPVAVRLRFPTAPAEAMTPRVSRPARSPDSVPDDIAPRQAPDAPSDAVPAARPESADSPHGEPAGLPNAPADPTAEQKPSPDGLPPPPPPPPPAPPVPATEQSPASPPSSQTGGSRVGGSQQAAADPARMSDSESDPFSRLGTAIVRDGRLQIRFGRKVKTRRPKLLLAAQVDLMTLRRAQVVLKIDIDETGKVTQVKVTKSSGSNDIDQPTRVAVYDWWFEPKRDASGHPVPDEISFTIGWR